MPECLFCKIAKHEMAARIAYEDELAVAFHDLNPQAPIHLLIVPKRHIENVLDLTEEDSALVGHLHLIAARLADEHQIAESGFRLLTNTNRNAGQSVPHLHYHLLGGRVLHWPPG